MFEIRWRLRPQTKRAPTALEWWERSFLRNDPAEQVAVLRRQLWSEIVRAKQSERPEFLAALGRDVDNELQALAARVAFGVGESTSSLHERCRLLQEMVAYYGDVVRPWTRAPTVRVELSDCLREAVAGLSAEVPLVLRVEGEPIFVLRRRRLIALFELGIRAASPEPDGEVEVVLDAQSSRPAVVEIVWGGPCHPSAERNDNARFLALAVAYVMRLGGSLRRVHGPRERLMLEIPRATRSNRTRLNPHALES